MKADGRVEVVVIAVRGVHRLRSAHLLRGLAEELDRAGQPVALHRRLGGEDARQGADAERGVRVGVAGRALVEPVARLAVGHRRLRHPRHRVVLRVCPEHRLAAAVGGAEGGRHRGATGLDVEPLLPQHVDEERRRPVLAPRGLRVVPHQEVLLGQGRAVLLDPVEHRLLLGGHGHFSKPPTVPPLPSRERAGVRGSGRWRARGPPHPALSPGEERERSYDDTRSMNWLSARAWLSPYHSA